MIHGEGTFGPFGRHRKKGFPAASELKSLQIVFWLRHHIFLGRIDGKELARNPAAGLLHETRILENPHDAVVKHCVSTLKLEVQGFFVEKTADYPSAENVSLLLMMAYCHRIGRIE